MNGEKLRKLRKDKGLTLEQFAKICGVSKSRLSDLENGLANPTVETLRKIAKTLKIPMEDLL